MKKAKKESKKEKNGKKENNGEKGKEEGPEKVDEENNDGKEKSEDDTKVKTDAGKPGFRPKGNWIWNGEGTLKKNNQVQKSSFKLKSLIIKKTSFFSIFSNKLNTK